MNHSFPTGTEIIILYLCATNTITIPKEIIKLIWNFVEYDNYCFCFFFPSILKSLQPPSINSITNKLGNQNPIKYVYFKKIAVGKLKFNEYEISININSFQSTHGVVFVFSFEIISPTIPQNKAVCIRYSGQIYHKKFIADHYYHELKHAVSYNSWSVVVDYQNNEHWISPDNEIFLKDKIDTASGFMIKFCVSSVTVQSYLFYILYLIFCVFPYFTYMNSFNIQNMID